MRVLRRTASFDPLLQEVARRICLGAAGRIRQGYLVVTLPDGSRRVFGDATSGPVAEMIIHDLDALRRIYQKYKDDLLKLAVMLAEVGMRSTRRRELAGRLPGFALLFALPMIETGVGTTTSPTRQRMTN